jgi:hypothetical protein
MATTRVPQRPLVAGHLMPGLRRYQREHLRPGGFLYAMLTGDYRHAERIADAVSATSIDALVRWFAVHLPPEAYGSEAKVEAWIDTPPEAA